MDVSSDQKSELKGDEKYLVVAPKVISDKSTDSINIGNEENEPSELPSPIDISIEDSNLQQEETLITEKNVVTFEGSLPTPNILMDNDIMAAFNEEGSFL